MGRKRTKGVTKTAGRAAEAQASSGAASPAAPAREPRGAAGKERKAARPRRPLSPGKKLLFAAICFVVFPALAVLLAELTLRAAGYGFSPSFFLERRISGEKVLVDNAKFGWRFFPPTISRRPHDFVLPARKPEGAFRVFVFGESAAWGDPDPSFGMARILQTLLTDQFPGIRFEVVNAAMAAISSHVVYQIARDAAKREPDAFIVYMGNNEVIGPFGPGTVFSGFSENIHFIRLALWARAQALTQFILDMKTLVEGRHRQPQVWAGMQMFEENKVRSDDPRLETMYRHFRRNLTDIIRAGKRAGAGVVVCNMAANFGGWGPHASLHRAGLSADELKRWEEAFEAGRKAQEAKDWSQALARYEEAEKIDATYAELQFRLGKCHEALGRFDRAKDHYARAIDEDCLRFRTDSRLNEIIRETAAGEQTVFVDVRKHFAEVSPNGIPGMNLLDDHVHMNFEGNYRIARLLLPEMAKLVEKARPGAKARDLAAPLALEECASRLALTGYSRYRITERNLQRVKNPPFTSQADHEEHLAYFTGLLDELSTHTTPAGLKASAEEFQKAIAAAPDDWVLHENLADLYQRAGQSRLEEAELRRVLELLPHHEERYAWLGQSLLNQGRNGEAAECYRKAIAYDPTNTKAYTGLGSALLREGKVDEGIAQYEAAVRVRPGVAESYNELGEVYYRADRIDQAEKAFAEAARLKPDYALAHTNLGVLQISRGRPDAAVGHLQRALEIRPDFPDALRHLGGIYVESGRQAEALALYERALEKNPGSAELHDAFAQMYARMGRLDDAMRELRRAIEVDPEALPARKNLGQLLVRSGRRAEAAEQYREILRRRPDDPDARQALAELQGSGAGFL